MSGVTVGGGQAAADCQEQGSVRSCQVMLIMLVYMCVYMRSLHMIVDLGTDTVAIPVRACAWILIHVWV